MKGDDKEKLRVFLHEANIARGEISDCVKQEIRALFTFMTLTGGVFLIMFKPEIFQEYIRGDLFVFWMFFIGQIEFVVVLVAISQYSILSMRVGHLRVIEKKINNLFNEPLVIWESEIAKYWGWNVHGSFLWTSVLISLFLGVIFVIMTAKIFSEDILFGTIMVLELIITLLLIVSTYKQANKVTVFAERKLSVGEAQLKKREVSNDKPTSTEK